MATVLIVEDHANVRRSMALMVEQDGHVVLEAATASDALALLRTRHVDVVVSDVRMPGDHDGVSLLRSVKGIDPDIEVVLATAFGTIDHAVDAIKCGAYDYLTKPVDPERLLLTIRRAAERGALAVEVKQLRAHIDHGHLVARSRSMQTLVKQVHQLAQSDSTVLITGESGTGKELVARALYDEGPRRHGKFVPVNCGALTESILESELFGHRKGAFTGAVADKKGLLEEADGGVLFLDEIGEMPQGMQVRLLRFLQGGEVRRLGETQTRRVNVRLVAATHRSLENEVSSGRFRQDFYYRINVVSLHIPPLRERLDDLSELATHFLHRVAVRARRKVTGLTPRAMELLLAYTWPGNVRELENAIERATNLASGDLITEADLPAAVTVTSEGVVAEASAGTDEERTRLLSALERSRWNQSRAAEVLGISRTTLWRKLREHRIET